MSIFSAIGGLIGGFMQRDAMKDQMRFQQEYAQKNIRWKVKDAKAAGVHPLAALGVQPAGGAPVQIPDFSDMGQNIGRAADAVMTAPEKENDYTRTMQALNVEKSSLENDVIRMNLANSAARTVAQAGNPPTLMPVTDNFNELTQGRFRVPGKPDRQEVQSHNRWQDSVLVLPDGPTGQDYEDQFGDAPLTKVAQSWRLLRALGLGAKRSLGYYRAQHDARNLVSRRRRDRTDHGYW